MNQRMRVILLVAFLVSGVAVVGLLFNMKSKTPSAPTNTGQKIVAAKTDVKAGMLLREENLTLIDYPGTPPAGSFHDVHSLIGRGVAEEIYAGDLVNEKRLAQTGSGGGLAVTIPAGMRGVAVKVDEVEDLAGYVIPGMRVDVLASGNPPSEAGSSPDGTHVRTVLQNIKVLSAGTNMQRDAEGKPQAVQVVNLLVSPEQAEILSLAGSQSHLQLALRNPTDTNVAEVSGSTLKALYGAGSKVKVAEAPSHKVVVPTSQTYGIEVINGSKASVIKFPVSEGKL